MTGGDSGIGRAAAIAYAKEGADVAIAYHPDEQADADEVKAVIEKAGQKLSCYQATYEMQHMRNKWLKMHMNNSMV